MWCPCFTPATRSAVDRIKKPGRTWPTLFEFGLTHDESLLFRWWCRSSAKMTKRVAIEKSKLVVAIPKIIAVLPYPYNYLVIYPLSLNYFASCPLSLKPLTGPLKRHRFYRFPWPNVHKSHTRNVREWRLVMRPWESQMLNDQTKNQSFSRLLLLLFFLRFCRNNRIVT